MNKPVEADQNASLESDIEKVISGQRAVPRARG